MTETGYSGMTEGRDGQKEAADVETAGTWDGWIREYWSDGVMERLVIEKRGAADNRHPPA